jgi:peptidoglycan/xylan/chitin deacetylase (PgdA/CDA1 family)
MRRTRTLLAIVSAIMLAGSAGTVSAAPTTYPKGYNTWACGNTSNRVVLTFDDRPTDHGSPFSYNDTLYWGGYLKSQGIRAMFFFNDNPTWFVNELRKQGHYVGNHGSARHPHFPTLTPAQLTAEVNASVKGNMIRPPHGDYNAANKAQLQAMGYRVCTWHAKLSTKDWEPGTGPRGLRSADSIRSIIRNGLPTATGGVVLGHMWTNFPQALPGIVADVRRQGREFCRNTGPVTATVPFPLKCT